MRQARPLVTVCLPVYQGAAFLEQALESVLRQTITDIEVLVPDDCSTDNSFDIVSRYAKQDHRVKNWKNHKRLGLFQNYNQCLRNALGKYIKPMSQDDVISPLMLERCLAILESNDDINLVSTARDIIDCRDQTLSNEQMGLETPISVLGEKHDYCGAEVIGASLLPLRNFIGEPCATMFRSNSCDQGNFFDDRLFHLGDLELWLQLLRTGDLAFISDPLVKFRRHKSSESLKNLRQLRIASDIVHISSRWAPTLKQMGYSEMDFLSINLAAFASSAHAALDSGLITEKDLNSDSTLARHEEFGLKKALLTCLILYSRGNLHQPKNNTESHRVALGEAKISLLMRSFPWRITRILRELNKLRKGTMRSLFKAEQKDETNGFDYIEHLRLSRYKIVKSKSWMLGRRLMRIARQLGLN